MENYFIKMLIYVKKKMKKKRQNKNNHYTTYFASYPKKYIKIIFLKKYNISF